MFFGAETRSLDVESQRDRSDHGPVAAIPFKTRAREPSYTTRTVINTPRVSKGIAWSYGGLTIFIAALTGGFATASVLTPMGAADAAAAVGTTVVGGILFRLWRSLYTTSYVVTDDYRFIETTRLIGGHQRIHLTTIEALEPTRIPCGIKIFGASCLGGYYWIPDLGTAFMAITNRDDDLLISTLTRRYIITPQDPHQSQAILTLKRQPKP